MIVRYYSIMDEKVGTFGIPWTAQSDGDAIRSFADAVNDGSNPNNMWHKHPEDFSLHFVASFDQVLGVMEPAAQRNCLVTASALKSFAPSQNGVQKIEMPA